MSETSAVSPTLFRSLRATLAVSGVLMLIAGLLVLIWPEKVAVALTFILAIYFIVAGVVYIGIGIFAKDKGGWARFGHILLGLLYIVAAIIAFSNLQLATEALLLFVGILVGVMWIVDGVIALTLLGRDGSSAWTVIYAILSIIAGIVLVISPMWGVVVLMLLAGISLIVLGILQIVRAITFAKDMRAAA